MKTIRQTGHVTTTPLGVDQLVTKGNKEVAISSLSPIVKAGYSSIVNIRSEKKKCIKY